MAVDVNEVHAGTDRRTRAIVPHTKGPDCFVEVCLLPIGCAFKAGERITVFLDGFLEIGYHID